MSDCNSLFISQKGIHNICLDANCSPHILSILPAVRTTFPVWAIAVIVVGVLVVVAVVVIIVVLVCFCFYCRWKKQKNFW